jgi:IS5 family transposase
VENPYWQVFTGETYLQTEPPIDPSSVTRWVTRDDPFATWAA